MREASPTFKVTGLSKAFPGQLALNNVSVAAEQGQVHGLVGLNGSGKSTLVKILAGFHSPDSGRGWIDGSEFALGDAHAARQAGLRFVHQDLGLVGSLGAVDNLALGRGYPRNRAGSISWKTGAARAKDALESIGYDLDINAPVASLTASERTAIAIARILEGEGSEIRVVVFDEPTAALPAAEVERLFRTIRSLCTRGIAVIYISHRLPEIFQLTDQVSVLRDGVLVGTSTTSELSESQLISMVAGGAIETQGRSSSFMSSGAAHEVLRARSVCGKHLRNVDLTVHAGEIVGIAGVTGSGREELLGALFGATPRGGDVEIDGTKVPADRPDIALGRGLALVPSDRSVRASLAAMSVGENITIAALSDFCGPGGIRPRLELREAMAWITRFQIRPGKAAMPFWALSGGNQQKAILARAIRTKPRVLLLDEPTHGVDLAAKATIYELITRTAQSSLCVVVSSPESEELITLCDRVLIMRDGSVAASYSTAGMSSDELTSLTLAPN